MSGDVLSVAREANAASRATAAIRSRFARRRHHRHRRAVPEGSLSWTLTVIVDLGPITAPPVGLDSSIVNCSIASRLVSLTSVISTSFHSLSPSAHETTTGSAMKSSPAVAVPEVGVIVTETAPLDEYSLLM